MKGVCIYCQKEIVVEAYENPYTHEIHLTCEKCKLHMSRYVRERIFLSRLGFIGTPILILISIICFIVVNWQIGVLFIVLGILNGVISSVMLQRFITKRDKELGTYIDVKKIKWCKTCKHFKKIRNYEAVATLSEEMIENSKIPCRILDHTYPTWEEHFATELGQRTLYPKNCPRWEKK